MNLAPINGRRALRGALLCVLLGLPMATALAEISVAIVPPVIEKTVRPGAKISDTLSYTNQGSTPVVVQVDFADFGVGESGNVIEHPPGTHDSTLVRHLRVSPLRVRVVPNQQVYFRYSVETPEEFSQLRSMIFLSSYPDEEAGANQVRIVPRLGVPLYVENVKAAPASLVVRDVIWGRSEARADTLRLDLNVLNQGERNIRPSGTVQVESKDGEFYTTFEFNEGREPVLPGQKRRWEQQFGPVPEGELTVKLRLTDSPRTSYRSAAEVPAVVR